MPYTVRFGVAGTAQSFVLADVPVPAVGELVVIDGVDCIATARSWSYRTKRQEAEVTVIVKPVGGLPPEWDRHPRARRGVLG
jgi:hypothetical protein